eukprot:TCONS_00038132-protein
MSFKIWSAYQRGIYSASSSLPFPPDSNLIERLIGLIELPGFFNKLGYWAIPFKKYTGVLTNFLHKPPGTFDGQHRLTELVHNSTPNIFGMSFKIWSAYQRGIYSASSSLPFPPPNS